MTPSLSQPVPKNLREQMIRFIESAPEERLPDLHRRLLLEERDRLWKQVQEQAQADYDAGKYEGVSEMIHEYRTRNRRP